MVVCAGCHRAVHLRTLMVVRDRDGLLYWTNLGDRLTAALKRAGFLPHSDLFRSPANFLRDHRVNPFQLIGLHWR